MTPKITKFNEAIVNAMLVYGMRYITHCVLAATQNPIWYVIPENRSFFPSLTHKKNRNNSKLLSIGFSNKNTLIQRRFYVRNIPISHGIEISRYIFTSHMSEIFIREREIYTCVNYMRRCRCNVCGCECAS